MAEARRPEPTPDAVKAAILAQAHALGFEAAGVAGLDAPWPASARLAEFVAEGRHGAMAWMETTLERRSHPRAMWAQARSAIVLGLNYGPDADPRALQGLRDRGAISAYAQGDDYHALIKTRLKALGRWTSAAFGCELKVFVDTAPLMEKPLAEAAGLGWQGKHTNLVSRTFGSWLFLGAMLTTLDLAPDTPTAQSCGSCRACLDACPTDAFPAPFQIDARRCLSYLTIEHADPIDPEFRSALGNRIYGCDDCLAACPWNKFASIARESAFHARDVLRAPSLEALSALDDAGFRALFAKSPVKRIGRDRFVRNVMYAVGNSRDRGLAGLAVARLDDDSALVRGAAVWALSRLVSPQAFAQARGSRIAAETHAGVLGEWLWEPGQGDPASSAGPA